MAGILVVNIIIGHMGIKVLKSKKSLNKIVVLADNSDDAEKLIDLANPFVHKYLRLGKDDIYEQKAKMFKLPYVKKYTANAIECNPYDFFLISDKIKNELKISERSISKELLDEINDIYSPRILKLHSDLEKLFVRPLRDFQLEAVERMSGHEFFLNGDEVGSGKSSMALATILNLIFHKKVARALIIATSSSIHKWGEELVKMFGKNHPFDLAVAKGTPDERMYTYRKKHQITVVNLESFNKDYQKLRDKVWGKKFLNRCVVVLDEAHRIKNVSTKSNKACCAVGRHASYRYALTGTPLDGKLQSVFGIFKYLNSDVFVNFESFKNFHIVTDYFGSVMEHLNEDVVKRKISPFMIRRKKREIINSLPDIIEKDIFVEMSDKHKKIYNEIELGNTKYVKKHLQLENSVSIFTALCQFCDDPSLVTNLNDRSSKLNMLKELLDEIIESGNKVVVFTKFYEMLKILDKELASYNHCVLHGAMNSDERTEAIRSFLSSVDKKVFIMTTAGKESIDLHGMNCYNTGQWLEGASYLIKYDVMLNPAVNEQINGRIDRIGQTKNMTVINLFTKGTIEETDIRRALIEKMKINQLVLENEGL